MKLLKDEYRSMYGSLEVETEAGSILNSPVKFSIDYELDWDNFPNDEICEDIEKSESLEEVLKGLDSIDLIELSFKSFSLGYIYDEEDEEDRMLELKIDFITNIEQEEDITDTGRNYQEVLPEIMEMLEAL